MSRLFPVVTAIVLSISVIASVTYAENVCCDSSDYRMDIYSDGKKVGYSRTSVKHSEDNIIVSGESGIDVTLMGNRQTVRTSSEYVMNDNSVVRFSYKINSGTLNLDLDGTRNNGRIEIMNSRGEKRYVQTDADRKYIPSSFLPYILKSGGLKQGKRLRVHIFDPVTFYTGGDTEKLTADIDVGAKERVSTPAGSYTAYKVDVSFLGTETSAWITPGGLKIKEYIPPGFVSYLSANQDSGSGTYSSVDIPEKTAVHVSKKIENPRDVKELTVRIGGDISTDKTDIHDGYRQFLNGRDLLIVPVKQYPDPSLSPSAEVFDRYLEGSNLINPDHPGIREKSIEIAGDEDNRRKKVELINNWIYNNIEKTAVFSIPDAAEVFETLRGDCNEHTVLFTALARASNIPVKVVMGLVYVGGSFQYHAWNEVYTDRWIPVDSTFGQVPADATHIKILEGDISRSPEILSVVGKIELDVLYYE